MSRIVLSTSSSGLDNFDFKTNIRLIRLRVYVNNIEFIDGRNINIERLKGLMNGGAPSPVYTKAPPSNEIADMFTDLINEGYKDVFVVTLSSKLSKSHEVITKVAATFKHDLNIHVYDSKELNICEATLALEAEHLIKQDKSLSDIAKRLDELRASHDMLFAIEDLSHLITNKKISSTSGFFANLLNIKPVLKVTEEGYLVPATKVRKFEKALEYIIEAFADRLQQDDSFTYVLDTGNPELTKRFVTQLKMRTQIDNIPILPISAISMANHGPTGLALCQFAGHKPYANQLFK